MIATIAVIAVVAGVAAPAAAQPAANQTVDNATDAVTQSGTSGETTDAVTDEDGETTNESLIYQFDGGGELRSVEYRDGSTYVTIAATPDDDQRFAISEGDLSESGSFEYVTVSVDAGETRTVELPVPKAAVVVTTTQDGYYHRGSVGPPVITGRTTTELLQIAGISGLLGGILALAVSAGHLKRKHKNSYKELFSEERKEIDKDAFEGWRDRIISWLSDRSDNRLSTVAGLGVLAYVSAVVAGVAAPPGDLWISLSDTQRLTAAGTVSFTLVGLAPMYYLADRLYNPDRDFVLDLDSQDVYRAQSGDKSGTVAAYSAPPERISEMDVDGAPTTITTPGGRCHLVRGFDPEENTAEANPPELADDREASIEVQKIDHNREILTDLATIGRDLIGAMSAFRVTADSAAMQDIDAGLRNTVSAGSDSLEDVLSEAVAGTRYEGTYQPESQTTAEIDDDTMTNDTDDTDEATNDGGTDDE